MNNLQKFLEIFRKQIITKNSWGKNEILELISKSIEMLYFEEKN